MSTSVQHKRRFFDFFPTPKFLEMPSVGIDISDQAVRFVEIKHYGYHRKKFKLGAFGEKKIPDGVITGGFINKPEEIKNILTQIRKEHGFKFVSASLPEEKGYLFKTEVPNIDRKDIASNIEMRLEENVPVGASKAVFDYSLIHTNNIAQHLDAVVTVVPNKVIDVYADLFEAALLVPISYELVTRAVAQAVVPHDETETCLIIYVGDVRTGFGIVSDGALQFTSTVNVGGLVDAANLEKRDSLFKDEITKLNLFWQNHIEKDKNDKPISKVILCGKDASTPGFKEKMATVAGVPVGLANVWVNIFDFEVNIPALSAEDSLNYAPAIGLAFSRYHHA